MGRYSGWTEFRYGRQPSGRKPYLAKSSSRPKILPAPARTELVKATAEILASAELSKFEHEASCRHGIRTTLILQGEQWEPSDEEAAAIVTAALDKIGAVRPRFLEGQPEFSYSTQQCQRCGAPLEDDAGHRRYCSQLCYESARRYRNDFWQRTQDLARNAAAYQTAKANADVRQCVVCSSPFRATTEGTLTCSPDCAGRLRRTVPERQCAHCGEAFRPHSLTKVGKFCSPACHAASRRVHVEQPCAECGTPFLPSREGVRFCCVDCARSARSRIQLPPRSCACCGNDFTPKAPHAQFCSPLCKERARMRRDQAKRRAAG